MHCDTITKMVRFQESDRIVLPSNFIENNVEAKIALLILVPSTKIIQIILLKRPLVWKVAIQMVDLSPEFLQEIDQIFNIKIYPLTTYYDTTASIIIFSPR